jgi:hypothetical protein
MCVALSDDPFFNNTVDEINTSDDFRKLLWVM